MFRTRKPSALAIRPLSFALAACLAAGVACDPADPEPGETDSESLLKDKPLGDMIQGPVSATRRALTVDAGATPPMPLPPPPMPPPPEPDSGAGGSTGRDAGVAVDGPSGRGGSGGSGGGPGGNPGCSNPGPFPVDAGRPPPGKGEPPVMSGGGCITDPLGSWMMDDCNPDRTELRDSTFNQFTAYRSLGVSCTAGVEGQGVTLPAERDIVYVPDQPVFAFNQGVTVAAWVKPKRLGGLQTIIRKREEDSSSFALMVVGKRYTFVMARQKASPVAIDVPATAGVWTHVAATYDGVRVRLYINGKEKVSAAAKGRIQPGEGPLLMGNDGSLRRFDGAIDNVWFATTAATPETILGLQCLHHPPALKANPMVSAAVQPGTPVTYDFAVTNQNSETCPTDNFFLANDTFVENFTVEPSFQFLTIDSGQTQHVPVTITSSEDVDNGSFDFSFRTQSFSRFDPSASSTATVTYVVSATGCRVSTACELMIRDVSVVDDPVRTSGGGAWSFRHLMEQLAAKDEDAPAMVERLLGTFATPQTINTFIVNPRPGMQSIVLDPWPRGKDGGLDLDAAPMRLLAIVNRLDVRNLSQGHAGEGRFIFGILDAFGNPLEATMILEYHLPATTEADVQAWANRWHALGALARPSEEYNSALQAVTDLFTRRGAAPGQPNGSALAQLRTNEISLGDNGIWELREFLLDGTAGLVPTTIKLTPDRPAFDGSQTLADFVNANESAILAEKHDVPLTTPNGTAFLAGAVFNDLSAWQGTGINNPEARHKFSLNTCNGCHAAAETNTFFLQVSPRFPGQQSFLSGFLTGTTAFDPVTGQPRTLNDLSRRNRDLRALVCPPDQIPPPPPAPMPPTMPPPPPKLSIGIGRVH